VKVTKGEITSVESVVSDITNSYYTVGDFYVYGGESPIGSFTIDDRIVQAIDIITKFYSINKLRIQSTYRSKEHNEYLKTQGFKPSDTSKHLSGQAVDFNFSSSKYDKIKTTANVLKEMYVTEIRNKGTLYNRLVAIGIGEFELADTHLHLAIKFPVETLDYIGKNIVSEQSTVISEAHSRLSETPTKGYYEYYHQDSSITTFDGLYNMDNSPISRYSIGQQDFCEFKNVEGVSNLDCIWKLYTEEQKIKFSAEYSSLRDQGNNAKGQSSIDSIKRQKRDVKLKFDPDIEINIGTLLYIPKNKANVEVLAMQGKSLFMVQQNLTTFMWDEFKALVTDPTYIQSSNVSIKNQSYFVNYLHLSFNCWVYVRALDKILNITPFVKAINTVVSDGGGTFNIALNDISSIDDVKKYSETYYSYVQKITDGNFNVSYFQKYIQQNDIVFIRYERLDIEGDADKRDNDLYVMKSSLPNKVYDMMGLIDVSTESYSAGVNISMLNISGRDFTKMIIEDSSVFFPFVLVSGGEDFFLNYNQQDKFFKRMFVGEQFVELSLKVIRSIRDSLGFIFNQLTNVGILPDKSDLFNAYRESYNRVTKKTENRITKVYVADSLNKDNLSTVEADGVWKIIKVIVDNQLDQRRLNNGELSSPEGTIIDLIRRVCMEPLVEFWGDTYGDQFVFMARQPPLTKAQITDYFKNDNPINITADKVTSLDLGWDDTYYTWYQIQPLEGLYGSNGFIATTVMPIVYFEEFANVFGMHKKVISDSYLNASVFDGDQKQMNVDVFRQSLANDLKFLIESNAILPFTRKGTITMVGDRRIKKGMWIHFTPTDEIFYVRQVENSVSVSGNTLDRSTILTVERGMKKQFVIGKSDITYKGKNINYFDIINMDVILELLQTKIVDGKIMFAQLGNNVKLVDTDLFEFFSKRMQWQ